MSTPCRILFGGSFDPPQRAHRVLVERALAARPGAELLVLPAGVPPHKRSRPRTDAAIRLELCQLAFAGLPAVRVSDEEIRHTGTSYTILTVRRHREALDPVTELCWLLGSDSLLDLGSWRDVHEILRLCTILTVPRPGFDVGALESLAAFDAAEKAQLREGLLGTAAAPPISSSLVRSRIAAGEDVGALLEPQVLARIEALGLYREPVR